MTSLSIKSLPVGIYIYILYIVFINCRTKFLTHSCTSNLSLQQRPHIDNYLSLTNSFASSKPQSEGAPSAKVFTVILPHKLEIIYVTNT